MCDFLSSLAFANLTSTYQEFLATRLTQKVDGLNEQLDNIVKDANDHMSKLQRALKGKCS